jgi:hypothetical protein
MSSSSERATVVLVLSAASTVAVLGATYPWINTVMLIAVAAAPFAVIVGVIVGLRRAGSQPPDRSTVQPAPHMRRKWPHDHDHLQPGVCPGGWFGVVYPGRR